MNEVLLQKTEEWMCLERKTLEQRRVAEQFYETNLMKLIEEDFIQRNRTEIQEQVEHMIVSVGTSYEPIVLSLALLKPEKILFLYTEQSTVTLDKVVEYGRLKPSNYDKRKIDEIDPVDIYRQIKAGYLQWGVPKRIYMDFTGGTKAMSAACALAGTVIRMQMVYVASDDYLVDFRKPKPGSERLVRLDNPLTVFGDLEIEKTLSMFGEYNFAAVAEKLGAIKENIPDSHMRQELNFSYLLAGAYADWDALDFCGAYNGMRELERQLVRDKDEFPRHFLVRSLADIRTQTKYLKELTQIPALTENKMQRQILENKQVIVSLMFSMYLNAQTREKQEKYDMATLLMYRLLEMMEQRRLAKYNLFVSDACYEELTPNNAGLSDVAEMDSKGRMEWLRAEVVDIKKGLFGNRVSDYLPNPVSLLEGFILLSALRDPIVYAKGKNRLIPLKRMRAMVYLRNNSIFAHGLGPVPYEDYAKFRNFVLVVFRQFCKIEKVSFEKMEKNFSWILPGKEH